MITSIAADTADLQAGTRVRVRRGACRPNEHLHRDRIAMAQPEYQSTVSNGLREQVLAALRELLSGIEHADRVTKGAILADLRGERLQEVYIGLVTALMRMVFILFAEERGLLPMENDLYARSYSLSRLYAQLLEDHARFGDGIDDRYGAWARVTTLFRALHDGLNAADGLHLPERRGDLFNPDSFPFLEGRPRGSVRQRGNPVTVPGISDGIVFRILDKLLVLGGERLQYRSLDVEHVGSVYEGLMGFRLEVAGGESLCVTPEHVVVNLEDLLRLSAPERVKALKAGAGLDLKDRAAAEVKDAKTIDALQAALARRISSRQPGRIGKGSLYLQPGDDRRKSGSHYTPRSLTERIVETTLRPVLERLGPDVTPEQLLELKICDPAMGSAAFLVEVCRQLADHLVNAWRRTGTMPELPPDELPVSHARRLIAQRCLYGVDKNPLAVTLARLSMWLVAFAKDHPFTFVDHALRAGDSLVGLSKEQIANLSLDVDGGFNQLDTVGAFVMRAVKKAQRLRREMHAIGDTLDHERMVALRDEAIEALQSVRLLGDLVVAAFFSAEADRARKKVFAELSTKVITCIGTRQYEAELRRMVEALRQDERPLVPFHWEIEFPEVFEKENSGFDCFVGNPPFLGGKRISTVLGASYRDWLSGLHEESSSNTDLSAHFFRRAFSLMAQGGCFGLIATNTISQGDTRSSGLRWLCHHGATIYGADRRVAWPGEAMVVVSVVHVAKGHRPSLILLNGKKVRTITAFLYARGGHDDPVRLRANADKAFIGCFIRGKGFIFDDAEEESTPVARMRTILDEDSTAAQIIRPFIGGEEVLTSPTHAHHRYIIRFGARDEADIHRWPALQQIVTEKVRPYREALSSTPVDRNHKRLWWRFGNDRPELYAAIANRTSVLVIPRVCQHLCAAFLPADMVFSDQLVVVPAADCSTFALVSSSVHNDWTRALASTLGDGLRYTPSDCFETFPFPRNPQARAALECIGQTYYAHRASVMVKHNEGLTKTYNRFHDPEERSPHILKLRALHAEMDRVVLDTYGWADIEPVYDFREQLDESIRLTWTEDTRDEVLARLLELNRVMAEEDAKQTARVPTKKSGDNTPRKPNKVSTAAEATGNLFTLRPGAHRD